MRDQTVLEYQYRFKQSYRASKRQLNASQTERERVRERVREREKDDVFEEVCADDDGDTDPGDNSMQGPVRTERQVRSLQTARSLRPAQSAWSKQAQQNVPDDDGHTGLQPERAELPARLWGPIDHVLRRQRGSYEICMASKRGGNYQDVPPHGRISP